MHLRNAYAPQVLPYVRDRDLFEVYALLRETSYTQVVCQATVTLQNCRAGRQKIKRLAPESLKDKPGRNG